MNEKAYRAMSFGTVVNVIIGVVLITVGVTTGILAIIGGARLHHAKKGLTF